MKKLNKKGFTLIELLAVIVILGILMLIAIPAVTKYINSSKFNAFRTNAGSIIDVVRNDVALSGQTSCVAYINEANIKLEKGSISGLSGYVRVDTQAAEGSKYMITIYDSENKYYFNNQSEKAISDFEESSPKEDPITEAIDYTLEEGEDWCKGFERPATTDPTD